MIRHKRMFSAGLVLIVLSLVSFSSAISYIQLSLEELAANSDVIVIGTCVSKKTDFIAGHFETQMTFSTQEYLKGDMGSEISITLPGGEITEPLPLGQYVTGLPQFVTGEDVVLFLDTKSVQRKQKAMADRLNKSMPDALKKDLQKSTLPSSPDVVGYWQGKYTILTDPASGEKRVTRLRLETMGFVHEDQLARQLYSLVLRTKEQSPTKAKDLEQKVKNLLESQGKQLPGSQAQGVNSTFSNDFKQLMPSFSTLQRLEDLKSKINNAVKQQ